MEELEAKMTLVFVHKLKCLVSETEFTCVTYKLLLDKRLSLSHYAKCDIAIAQKCVKTNTL